MDYNPKPARCNNNSLGATIEEKTRRILGWTEGPVVYGHSDGALPVVVGQQRKAEKYRKSKSASLVASAPYPYSLLAPNDNGGKGRKSSCPSLYGNDDYASGLSGHSQQLTPPSSPVSALPDPLPPAYHHRAATAAIPPPVYPGRRMSCDPSMIPSCSSSPSSYALPMTPLSPGFPAENAAAAAPPPRSISTSEIFDRIRKEVPLMPKEQSKFRILVQTVANVIELESKLARLNEKERKLSNILMNGAGSVGAGHNCQQQHSVRISVDTAPLFNHPSNHEIQIPSVHHRQCQFGPNLIEVPDDLQNIDVTAFKSMMCSPNTYPLPESPPFKPYSYSYSNSNSVSSEASPLSTVGSHHGDCFENSTNYDNEFFIQAFDPLLVDTASY